MTKKKQKTEKELEAELNELLQERVKLNKKIYRKRQALEECDQKLLFEELRHE